MSQQDRQEQKKEQVNLRTKPPVPVTAERKTAAPKIGQLSDLTKAKAVAVYLRTRPFDPPLVGAPAASERGWLVIHALDETGDVPELPTLVRLEDVAYVTAATTDAHADALLASVYGEEEL